MMFTKISIISALTIGLLGSALATPMPLDVEILREGEVANLTDRAALTAFAYRWFRLDQCRANDPDQDIRRGGEYGTCYTAPDSGFGHATVQYDRAVFGNTFCSANCRGTAAPQGPSGCFNPAPGCAIGSFRIDRAN